jgi:hypothetical protein
MNDKKSMKLQEVLAGQGPAEERSEALAGAAVKAKNDFIVINQGTIWSFRPVTARAKRFVKKHVAHPRWLGSEFVVEHRSGHVLLDAIYGEGLLVDGRREIGGRP